MTRNSCLNNIIPSVQLSNRSMVHRSASQSSQRVWLVAQEGSCCWNQTTQDEFEPYTEQTLGSCIRNRGFEVLEVLEVHQVSRVHADDRFELNSDDSIYNSGTLESSCYAIRYQCWSYGVEWTLSIRELICDSDHCLMTECNGLVIVGLNQLEIGWNQKSRRSYVRAYQTDDSKCLKSCGIVIEQRMGNCFESNMSDLSSNRLT
jgi:hypothetical protein